jgi:hypothetical protein
MSVSRIAAAPGLSRLVVEAVEDRQHQLVLAAEVVKHRALGDSRRRGDAARRCGVEAVGGKQSRGGVENLAFALFKALPGPLALLLLMSVTHCPGAP